MKVSIRSDRLRPAALIVTTCLCACSSTPDKITLLPDPGGSVGAVVVKSVNTTQVIDTAYAQASVARNGAIEVTEGNPSDVQGRYGDLLAARPPRPMTFTINFLFDSATQMAPDSAATVTKLKTALATWPAPHLTVVGHTDSPGSVEFNDRLSIRRAQTVAAFLTKAGIPAQQIETAGRGKREPIVHTADGVPSQMNRRVVITIQ
ncbi:MULTISPECIES: OmpA family protein [Paraburkholderia]|uniref:OmpA family protein n=1 Tax=Paraburkholderia TaxID=1822464 RepID=UPI0022547D0F|nr:MULTISPECIES: OmpA family protein [Paraburkholderia]MCX4162284.1 OmpA family protein [Paraburkholderia megapolitana]MDN7157779.1 OmpA family protein [Paraburkholderia sp. CHISQ3]MDQ6494826.1 OmpA family protein [Paraburkholderia megapolitana]